jgi:hypothetical protein
MPTRLASLLLLVSVISALNAQTGNREQVSQRIWARGQMMRPDSAPELDPRAARIESIHHDAEELSALSASLQSDLQGLQKGMLAKDMNKRLRQMEKLSKRLRQELSQ